MNHIAELISIKEMKGNGWIQPIYIRTVKISAASVNSFKLHWKWMKNEWRTAGGSSCYIRVSFIPCFISFGEMKKRNWIQHSLQSARNQSIFHSTSWMNWIDLIAVASLRASFSLIAIHVGLHLPFFIHLQFMIAALASPFLSGTSFPPLRCGHFIAPSLALVPSCVHSISFIKSIN